MKLLFATALLLAGSAINAQEFQPDLDKLIANSKFSRAKKDTLGQIPNPFKFNQRSLEPKVITPGIYSLPQDGMPCIVPDTQTIATIPNAAKREVTPQANRIPNAMPDKRKMPDVRSWSK